MDHQLHKIDHFHLHHFQELILEHNKGSLFQPDHNNCLGKDQN